MTSRVQSIVLGLVALILADISDADASVELAPVRETVTIQDLANIAHELGLSFRIFDYETTEPHCIHFWVDVIVHGATTRHDGSGLCGLGGPARLTVMWKLNETTLEFSFKRFRRDIGQGGGVGGPSIVLPNTRGHSLYGIDPPRLSLGHEAVLVHGAYGWVQENRTDFKVVAELRPNPNKIIGTE